MSWNNANKTWRTWKHHCWPGPSKPPISNNRSRPTSGMRRICASPWPVVSSAVTDFDGKWTNSVAIMTNVTAR